VVSDWPGKCGICNMGLVRRKRGEAVPLPSGVVSRMQFSPFRLQLAGIQTAAVDYQPLAREVVAVGLVTAAGGETSPAVAEVELFPHDFLLVTRGQAVELECETGGGPTRVSGKVQELIDDPRNHRPRAR